MPAHFSTILPGPLEGADLDRMNLVLGCARYAMDRAFAHAEHPGEFPLPAGPDSLEKLLLPSIAKLKAGARRRMSADARERLKKATAERVAHYGEIGRNAPGPTVDALHEFKQSLGTARYQPSDAERQQDPLEKFRLHGRAGRAAAGAVPTRLELFAQQITCVDDTRELGKDEISLAGIRQEATIDAASGKIAGSRAIVDPVALGKFKGGDAPRPINRVLASFDLANAPKLCTFELFIAETDVLKGFANELKEARDFFPDHLSEIVSSIATAGLLLGASTLLFPGSWAVWVMVLVIIAIVLLGNAIYAGLRDDVFPSRQTGIPVTAPDFTFPGGALETDVQTAVFSKFGGTYRLDFIWRLV